MSREVVGTHPLLGAVRYRVAEARGGAAVELAPGWAERELVAVTLPVGTVRFHRRAAAQLAAAWTEVAAAGLLARVESFDGAWQPRLRRVLEPGTEALSAHAVGLAFDLNLASNPRGAVRCEYGLPGGVRELVPRLARHGLTWAGAAAVPDASHFEVTQFLAAGETLPTPAVLRVAQTPQPGWAVWRLASDYWVEAAALEHLLGVTVALPQPLPLGPGPHQVQVAVAAGSRDVGARRHGPVLLLPLGEVLPLTGWRAEAQPDGERVDLLRN